MKKLTFILSLFLMAGFAANAQTDACQSGFCPETITAHHRTGVAGLSVAPVDADITYNVVETDLSGATACWITQNLGASTEATSSTDATTAARGWFWQFNRKQGYQYTSSRTPNTAWISSIDETSDWLPANDPCTILLGEHWRIPTLTEWNTADVWASANEAYSSVLKLHLPGVLNINTGVIANSGSTGIYWSTSESSTTQAGSYNAATYTTTSTNKPVGATVRCLRTFSW